ncbi:TPA: type II toxin-antitoxin system death-on-curing family toxin [Providencia rettgeri]
MEQPNIFIYFDVEHAISTHDWIINQSGGRHGVIDEGLLHSPLQMIQNDLYYPTIVDKLTHLVYSINKNHAFNDGNKRSSLALGAYFLELNGYDYIVNLFIIEMENIAVWVADNAISKDLLSEIISDLIFSLEISEATKVKIYNSVFSHYE